jgi:hypothetical protein
MEVRRDVQGAVLHHRLLRQRSHRQARGLRDELARLRRPPPRPRRHTERRRRSACFIDAFGARAASTSASPRTACPSRSTSSVERCARTGRSWEPISQT